MMFDSLELADESKIDGKLRVRISWLWFSMATNGNFLQGSNLILLHKDVSICHKNFWKQFSIVLIINVLQDHQDYIYIKAEF